MITPQALSKYENGKMMPSSSVLVALGNALDVSLDFLMSSQVVGLVELEFRRHTRVSSKDLAMAEAACIDRLERYLAIERILDMPAITSWQGNLIPDRLGLWEELEDRAEELRALWSLGLDPIPSMCDLLEEKGIKVLEEDLSQHINGLACQAQVQNNRDWVVRAVLISRGISVERKRFTLAHELAHQVIGSTNNPEIDLEKAMDWFAGAFLVPRNGLREAAGSTRRRITYSEIMNLKRKFGVTASCVLTRLGQVGILPASTVKNAFRSYAHSWRKSEPEPMQHLQGFGLLERPSRFERLVLHALGEELISPIRAAELLEKPLEFAEQQVSGPAKS